MRGWAVRLKKRKPLILPDRRTKRRRARADAERAAIQEDE